MSYTPNTWEARKGTGLNRYIDQNGNYQTLTPAPESVTVPGTPFSVDWMNHLEQGVQEAAATADAALSPSNTSDWPVESGESNGWTYRKWNSGFVECWYTYAFTGDIDTAIGNMFYASVPSISYPFSITNASIQATYTSSTGYIAWYGGPRTSSSIPSNTETGIASIIRPTQRTGEIGSLNYYVTGNWK